MKRRKSLTQAVPKRRVRPRKDRIVQVHPCVVAFDRRAIRAGELTNDYVRDSRVDVLALTESGAVWCFHSDDEEWDLLPPLPAEGGEDE